MNHWLIDVRCVIECTRTVVDQKRAPDVIVASRVAKFYENQKNMMVEAAKQHLAGLAEWTEPQAGAHGMYRISM